MRPIGQGHCRADQRFHSSERLFRRVPADCIVGNGEIEPSCIDCSFGRTVDGAPSVIRSKYAAARDALHPNCADGKDVSSLLIYYLEAGELPKDCLDGTGNAYEFYPYHDPLEHCYAHSVIACRRAGNPEELYRQPTRPVKNDFRAKFAAALKPGSVAEFPASLIPDLVKHFAALKCPRS